MKASDIYSDQELIKQLPGFSNNYIETNGTRLHYVEGGEGAPLVLIPGWPETWWAYHKVMPVLSAKYRVIVVDVRGMGSSEKPLDGYDKKNMAKDIYGLVQQLNLGKIGICGHDIGAHVSFSFAATYPQATEKLIMLDTPHPDESMYQLPMLPIPGLDYTYPWWLAFNQVKALPESLLAGRMHLVMDWIFKALLKNPDSMNEFDKAVYCQAYDSPDGIRASNAWYQAFTQDIQDSKSYAAMNIPVLGIACSGSYGMLQSGLAKWAKEVNMNKIEDSGHFMLAEQPGKVAEWMMQFLG
ncbi:Pimeloyl-ACP methyl ester carboxylesterase [Filimonas lacunae]|uniref:Pimeloyl-ACP methyl ester carboxylesterase n=1 Tax=Filimonas lacunae TaxID=477680 RepID=A0A173MD00_9BACT|nr:alpha/beta hydrolase [Filimonas lacunae]BAV05464.1 alpha/beta hydrolase fold [Filimonas lacunae]SIT20973.1 Pimeloyl-ACP methyl ester carboxylesterase [Filimonas lacunae]